MFTLDVFQNVFNSDSAENLGSYTTKPFDQDDKYGVSGGDGGLDLVSFTSVDEMPFIPFSFAQCACSYKEWESKQSSIKPEKWNVRIHNLAPYHEFTFVPFYFRKVDGHFVSETSISTCLIDRHRIFNIVRDDRSIIEEFLTHPIYDVVKEIIDL